MAGNSADVDIDVDAARRVFQQMPDALDDAGERMVRQLSVLAEGAQKREAPEGSGRDKHLRDSIDTRFSRGGLTANVGARKKASDGTLLAKYVTGSPSYSPENPPPPLFDWAAAKLGDESLGWAVSQAIAQRGTQESFPDLYVDRSLDRWESDVEDVAGEQVRDAMSRLMRGA